MKRNVTVNITLEIPFEEYKTKKLNTCAKNVIIRWIKETIENELSYIPLWVEKSPNGGYIEDVTDKIKIKMKSV